MFDLVNVRLWLLLTLLAVGAVAIIEELTTQQVEVSSLGHILVHAAGAHVVEIDNLPAAHADHVYMGIGIQLVVHRTDLVGTQFVQEPPLFQHPQGVVDRGQADARVMLPRQFEDLLHRGVAMARHGGERPADGSALCGEFQPSRFQAFDKTIVSEKFLRLVDCLHNASPPKPLLRIILN